MRCNEAAAAASLAALASTWRGRRLTATAMSTYTCDSRACVLQREGGREGPGRETERIAIYHRETQTERERVYEEHLPIYFYLSIHRSLYLSTVSLFLCVTMCTLICILNYTNMSTTMYIHTVDGRNPAPPWMVETL